MKWTAAEFCYHKILLIYLKRLHARKSNEVNTCRLMCVKYALLEECTCVLQACNTSILDKNVSASSKTSLSTSFKMGN